MNWTFRIIMTLVVTMFVLTAVAMVFTAIQNTKCVEWRQTGGMTCWGSSGFMTCEPAKECVGYRK